MKSSFSELNNFWSSKVESNNLIILRSKTNEERSSFFIDLVLQQAQDNKVYICSSARYLLEDKIDSLDFKKRYNINFVEQERDLPLYTKGFFFFYEPTSYWTTSMQKLLANGKKVIVDYNSQANLNFNNFFSYQEIFITQYRKTYHFSIFNSWEQQSYAISCYKPSAYQEFSYFLETNNLKYLLEEFLGEKFHHRSFTVKNYYPKIVDLFDRKESLRSMLKDQMDIKSYKFYQKLKAKMVLINLSSVEINFAYLNLCLNILKTHPQVSIDHLYQLIDAPLDKIHFRRPHFEFFSTLKVPRIIRMITIAGIEDSCCLEALELDYELLLKRNNELKAMIPRKIQKLSDLKHFFSSLTYRYYENREMPVNIFHQFNHPQITSPRDYFELCQMKLQFKNCIHLYFNDIMDKKTIVLKVSHANQKFCLALDAKTYDLKAIKLSENRDPARADVIAIEEMINSLLQRSSYRHRLSKWWFQKIKLLDFSEK